MKRQQLIMIGTQIMLTAIRVLLLSGLFVGTVYAADCTHYVSNSGSATWANATNINTPSSAATAFANAVADNVACFRGGTYNVGPDNGDGYTGALTPAHSGTSGHPITFQAYPGEVPVLNGDSSNSGNYPVRVIGSGDNLHSQWTTFDGFTIQADSGSHAGSIVVGGGSGTSNIGYGYVVKNCIVIGANAPADPFEDNYEGIRTNSANNVQITNNKVYGFKYANLSDTTGNAAIDMVAIKIYYTDNLTISNNELYSSGSGISFKRGSNTVTISYNYIYNVNNGIWVNNNAGYDFGHNDWNIHNNVIYAPSSANEIAVGIGVSTDSGSETLANWQVYNNTIYVPYMAATFVSNATGLVYYNNIAYGAKSSDNDWGIFNTIRASTISEEDYNQWGPGTFLIRVRVYNTPSDYTSLANWQASTELIGNGHPGTGDLTSNPLFTNGSGNFSLLSDFNLQGGSPCVGTGKAGADIGANVALVGYNAGGEADTTAPSVTAFTIPSTASSLTVAIASFTCTDAVGVTGYCVTTTNSSAGCSWAGSAQSSVTFGSAGAQTAYGWCKDAADNVSDSVSDGVTITLAAPATLTGARIVGGSIH